MASVLKQSTAVDVLIGPFLDLTDGATAETGESPSVKLSKNGQTLAAKNDATTPTHDADGYYNCELGATDTNTVGTLVLTVAASGNALPVRHEFQVVEEAVYETVYAVSADLETKLDTIDSNVGAILVDTAEIGAAGAGLTAVPWNSTWDPEVQSECADALVAYDPATGAEIAALNDLSAAEVNTEVDTALSDYDGPTNTEMTAAFTEIKGATWSSATDTLEALRDRGDAAWTTATGFATHAAADVWSVATRLLTAGTNIVLAKGVGVTGFNDLSAAQVNTEADTALADYDGPTHAELISETNDVQTDIAALNDPSAATIASAVLTTTMTESYAANGAAPTLAQAQFAIHQMLMQFGISGTSITVRKLDNAATAFVVTLDDGTSPADAARV